MKKINFTKKSVALIILFAVAVTFFAVSPTKSRTKSYHSGDAVSYNGKIYIGTTNTGAFELFSLENDLIYKKATIQSADAPLAKNFIDAKFSAESGKLYVYLINGRYLYKYDITNPTAPKQVLKIKDNSWDWFVKVDVVNGNLVTVGSKGVKIWNKDYQVIDAYNMINEKDMGSITFSPAGDFMISAKDKVNIFSSASREKVAEFTIASADKSAKRSTVNDSNRSLIYIVDDESLKAVDFSGRVRNEFVHTSNVGYDVADSFNPDYIYFSDGIGVVKVRKADMNPVDWVYTTRLGLPGSWAMGLKAVRDKTEEKLVVFNGSNILVLDGKMQAVAHYEATEMSFEPIEELRLNFDKNMGAPNTQVSLRGQGFGLGEDLEIRFAKSVIKAKADADGRFAKIITVPAEAKAGMSDIKVVGKESGRTYSIGFKVE